MLRNGTQSQGWEEGQRGKYIYDKYKNDHKGDRIRAKGACGLIDPPLSKKGACDRQLCDDRQIPAEKHSKTCGHVPEQAVICQSLKARAIVGRRR